MYNVTSQPLKSPQNQNLIIHISHCVLFRHTFWLWCYSTPLYIELRNETVIERLRPTVIIILLFWASWCSPIHLSLCKNALFCFLLFPPKKKWDLFRIEALFMNTHLTVTLKSIKMKFVAQITWAYRFACYYMIY